MAKGKGKGRFEDPPTTNDPMDREMVDTSMPRKGSRQRKKMRRHKRR